MMSKIVFLTLFFPLVATNARLGDKIAPTVEQLVTIAERCNGRENPLGDGEEKSGEEDKDVTEEEDDDGSLDHRWLSREKSSKTDLHILYQEILFKDLEIEIVIPPPRA